ncbi:hypothetical protein ACFCQI_13260 [Rhodanobacter sp. FW102-FHT14D06]|uniref:Uncharacterized protein n=2 Tax=unclassified Rhodanobacter TaxID=2621553 RepID=A0AB74UQM9_9GAMM
MLRFARAEAGSTVIDVDPGGGDWTGLFSDIVGPEGRVCSFVPAEVAHLKNDPVGRARAWRSSRGESIDPSIKGRTDRFAYRFLKT